MNVVFQIIFAEILGFNSFLMELFLEKFDFFLQSLAMEPI